jgi:hypothetical protein
VLCPACIIKRLSELPECTVIFADIDGPAHYAAVQQAVESRLRGVQPSIQQVIEEMRAVGNGRYVNAPLDVRDVISPALPDPGSPEREK